MSVQQPARRVAVIGALGVIGRAVIEHVQAQEGWSAVGISRRPPDFQTAAEFLSVDLLDREDSLARLCALSDVTEIVYAAFTPRQSATELVAPNLAMLRNAVEGIEQASPGLRHVCLMEGGKAYGVHLGPFSSPAKESDPRIMPPVFYYDQQDFLRSHSDGKSWSWTSLRPEGVCGFALGNPMNLLMVIGVYAAICRELELPFRFPGTPAAYGALYQVTEARLLARAASWAAATPSAAGEAFNITNGDVFRWQQIWPRLAQHFGLPYGEPVAVRLEEHMADKAPVWEAIVRRHRLIDHPYEQIAAWAFGDAIFRTEYDNITSTIKARRHGFHDCIDTEEMFLSWFAELEERRILPRSGAR